MPADAASPQYPEAILRLAANPSSVTLLSVWKVLPKPERARALVAALEREGAGWFRRYLADELTRKLSGFRASTLMGWSAHQLAGEAVKRGVDKAGVLRQALIALHFAERPQLQVAFFDSLGIPHEAGEVEPGTLDEYRAPPERLAWAATRLVERHPGEAALFYLLCLRVLEPRVWAGLDSWFVTFAGSHRAATSPEGPRAVEGRGPVAEPLVEAGHPLEGPIADAAAAVPAAPAGPPRPAPPPSELLSLSALDDLVTLAIVDAAAQVAGAPAMPQVEDMVHELVQLNGRRHQSFYHLGFLDVMQDRPLARSLPAENDARRLWYLSGYLAGLARRGRDGDILALFDAEPAVRQLGRRGLGAYQSGPHVFTALCRNQRYAEAARFVTPEAVFESNLFAGVLFQEATALLRREQPTLARPMFSCLWQGLADRVAEGVPLPPEPSGMWTDVRRRLAHCLRYHGNVEAGRALLEEVLDDPDSDNRAAVLTDLGLCDAGYGRLFELRHPEQPADVADIVAKLRRGAGRFQDAMKIDVPRAAHADYVWGVLRLLEGRAEEAVPHLDRALALFESNPEVYRGGGLLVRARLHLGLAICHSLSALPRVPSAAAWIAEALRAGERVPGYVIADAIEAVALGDSGAATQVAEAVLEATGAAGLDVLATCSVVPCSARITDALVRRARDEGRSLPARAADWRHVLPALLEQRRGEEAAEGLDFLELVARDGVGAEEFLALLAEPKRYSPAWEPEDARWARVQLYEALGRYDEAARILIEEGHRLLASGEWDRLGKAEEVLDRLREYPANALTGIEGLRARYDALSACEERPEPPAEAQPVRVLVVGGNETQEQYDCQIEADLRRTRPWISARFIHTGWRSNWNGYLEEVRRELPSADAVVMLRLMRTELGRKVRKCLDRKPWRGCGGRGKAAILNSILAAAAAVRGRGERA